MYEYEAWVFSNILIGDSLGFIVDVMTEPGGHLTNMVRLKLHPSIFETHFEIDTYYDLPIFAARTNWTKVKHALRLSCDEPKCDELQRHIQIKNDAEQNALKTYCRTAKVAP